MCIQGFLLSWAQGIVEHMSERMCRDLLKAMIGADKLGFNPPPVKTFTISPDGYHEHNSYYNYVENFMINPHRDLKNGRALAEPAPEGSPGPGE